MSGLSPPAVIQQIADLADRYNCFLVDQFGVLHDGFNAYPGAADALRGLMQSGATVVIISNSGKRAESNRQRLTGLGFTDDCYTDLVSSGEVAWNLLKSRYLGSRVPQGASCYLLSNDNDHSALDGLGLSVVDSLSDAQLILLSGQHLDEPGLTELYGRLQLAVDNNLPCFCTNPDKIAYARGGKVFSSGTVAQWYEAQGGEVIWLGKPYADIYHYVTAQFNIDDPSKVVCVGDSIEHDIKGGCSQGLATVLVRTGILDDCDDAQIEALYRQHQAVPDYIIGAFG